MHFSEAPEPAGIPCWKPFTCFQMASLPNLCSQDGILYLALYSLTAGWERVLPACPPALHPSSLSPSPSLRQAWCPLRREDETVWTSDALPPAGHPGSPHLGGPWPVFRTIGGSPPIPAHSPPMGGAPMGALWVLPGQWCHLPNACPGCSLEGLMLKLKLQYFGQLVRRADSLEKTLMMGKIEGRRRRG